MTYKNSQMAGEARILKVVSTVVGLFALALVAVAIAIAPGTARPVVLLVAAGTFGLAVFMWIYASRPDIFSGDERGILGDELRSRYAAPTSWTDSPVTGAVSTHIYQWQSVRRVEPGDKIWTREYVRLVLRQSLGLVVGVAAFGAVVVGTTLGLGASVGPIWFVAAGIILAVGFNMSHRTGLVDATNYATTDMAALPDMAWTPVVVADVTNVVPLHAEAQHAA